MTEAASASQSRAWWETRSFAAAMILLAAVPLLYPPVPPLVDLMGHMGRYRVELDFASSPSLQRFFDFRWALVGNLGVDLLIVPFAKLFGLELGTKLIVLAIPPLTVAGFLWVAREVHGRVPPTALFALPFAYGHPFLYGFVNFALSMALSFLAFSLWLRLGRMGHIRLRLALFVPISFILFLCHVFGCGVFGLLAFAAEVARQHSLGRRWWRAVGIAALHATALGLPLLLLLLMAEQGGEAATLAWFDWDAKWLWLGSALRDRWQGFDLLSVLAAGLVVVGSLLLPRLTFARALAIAALSLAVIYALLPRIIFGSAYADMRLVPFLFAVALLGIRLRAPDRRAAQLLALLGLAFTLARTAATTLSLGIAAQDHQAKLAALDHVPEGARVLSLVGLACDQPWALLRNNHLGSMVIVRRRGFSNDQWDLAGAGLLSVRDAAGLGWFAHDPSQQVGTPECATRERWPVDRALKKFPRERFDYVWLIDPPPFDPSLTASFVEVWRGPNTLLYRVLR